MGGKHQCVVASHAPATGDLVCNPGMCPEWESNPGPFGFQACTQSIELHQPGTRQSLINPLPLGHPIRSPPSGLLYMKRKEMPLGNLLKHMGITADWQDTRILQSATGPCGLRILPCLRDIAATAFLIKATEKNCYGLSSNNFCTSCSRSTSEFLSQPASFS